MAVATIEKTMDVSGMRFAHFVRRYVLHKNWKKICEAMREYHKSTKRPAHVEKYLKIMEQRMKEVKLVIWVRNCSRSDRGKCSEVKNKDLYQARTTTGNK